MGLDLLDPILEESSVDSSLDEVLHFVCMPCNGGVVLPIMLCLCGYYDGGACELPGQHPSMEECPLCAVQLESLTCPKGHLLKRY